MKSFQNILCPVDFSDLSARALRYAVAFAEQYHSRLMVYHCIVASMVPAGTYPPTAWLDPNPQEAKEHLEEFTSPFRNRSFDMTTLVEIGSPATQILQTSLDEDADLIVMGTHGLTGHQAILMGSVTNQVLHKIKVPVLTVCKPSRTILSGDPDEPLLIGKILCAVDPAHINLQMLSRAMFLARSNHATIYFLAVHSPGERTRGIADLGDLIQAEKEQHCKVEFLESTGHPVEQITKMIRGKEIDLVVMGHRTKPSVALEELGSVTLRVVPQSSCPVLVVRD